MEENEISAIVIKEAILLHRELGPGLLESVYELLLYQALEKAGVSVQRQVPVRLCYRGITYQEAYRIDLLADAKVVIELKSVEAVKPVHCKQLLTYLKLSSHKLGLLINFNEDVLKDGLRRVVNGL